MKHRLPGALLGGLLLSVAFLATAGCSFIIGDIPIPDESRDLRALEGGWRLYGLAGGVALDARLVIDREGGIDWPVSGAEAGESAAPGRIRRDRETRTRYRIDFGPPIGEVLGRFDAGAGVGLFAAEGDAPVFAVLVREPQGTPTVPGGWTVTAGFTAAGLPFGGVGILEAGEGGFIETRHPLDRSGPIERSIVVDADSNDAKRLRLVSADDGGGARWLTPVEGGAWAMGVQRNGGQNGVALVWSPSAAPLPEVAVVCYGVALGGGEAGTAAATRVRTGRLGAVVRWSDGPSAPAVATGHGYALDAAGGFFEGIGTLVLAGDGGRVFALLPVEPGVDPKASVELAWGLGLCLRVSEAVDGDAAVDAGEDAAVDAGDGD